MTPQQEAIVNETLRIASEGLDQCATALRTLRKLFSPDLGPVAPTRDTLTFNEACQYVGCGRTKFRELIAEGEIPKGADIAGRLQWKKSMLDGYKQRQFAKREEKESVKRLRLPKR